MTQDFDIFVINLERACQRRDLMSAQLDRLGVEYAFFKAIDGRFLDPALEREWFDDCRATEVYGKPLTPGEKGCALSHILLWKKIAQNVRNALILEDDIILPKKDLARLIGPIFAALGNNRVVLLRRNANSFWWRGRIHLKGAGYCLRKPNHNTLMAAAYIISPAAAQMLLAHLMAHKLAYPVDWWYRHDGKGFTKIVDTWATSRELIRSNRRLNSEIDSIEGDRDGLKALTLLGWVRRYCFLALRLALYPGMRMVRSFMFKPLRPSRPTP